MNCKKVILSALLAAGCLMASAQEEVKTEYIFQPHWYGQLQVGMQETLGEVSFGDLASFNAQVALGYQFSSVWGARLAINGMTSKGGSELKDMPKYTWKYNYISPTLDATFDVTNAIWGFNPTRKVSFGVFAGVGFNFAWDNDEAAAAKSSILAQYKSSNKMDEEYTLRHLWDERQVNLVGQFGANVDFRLTDNLSAGIEFGANVINDHYNSKHADNADWYFNTLAGVKYAFGKTYEVRTSNLEPATRVEYIHDTIYIEVQVPTQPTAEARESIRRDVFYVIRGSEVRGAEMEKLQEIVDYLRKYPDAKVDITGYADKGTGNAKINALYAKKRANQVADILQNQFGLSSSRMNVTSKGDTEQPYAENDKNRVTICIAE